MRKTTGKKKKKQTGNHKEIAGLGPTKINVQTSLSFLRRSPGWVFCSGKMTQKWRDTVMDSTFLEGQTETRLILQVSNTSSMVLMEPQQLHPAGFHMTRQAGPQKSEECQARHSTLHNGHLKERQQSLSGFLLLVWLSTAFFVTFLGIWKKRDEGVT